MSVRVMSAVFERYSNGGGEMLLALALADHSDDAGGSIFPSVKTLAKKTRQSTRSVQYQLRKMEKAGWLVLVAHEGGGRGRSREYCIHPDWVAGKSLEDIKNNEFSEKIKGAIFSPIPKEGWAQYFHPILLKGATSCIERAQPTTQKGAIAVAPEPSVTISEPSLIKTKNIKDIHRAGEFASFLVDRFHPTADDIEYCAAMDLSETIEYITALFQIHHREIQTKTYQAQWSRLYRGWVKKNQLPPLQAARS